VIPSFVSFAVSNSAPASVVTAGRLRYQLYRRMGVTPVEAAGVAAFNLVTWATGISTLGALVLLLRAGTSGGLGSLVPGVLLLLLPAGYLAAAHLVRGPIRVMAWTVRLPPAPIVRRQFAVSIADWMLSGAALFVLIRSVAPVPYVTFMGSFFLAQTLSLLFLVPGGLGVFEASVLVAIPGGSAAPAVLAALFAYRVIYYLFPLTLAGVALTGRAVEEARSTGHPLRALAAKVPEGAHTIVAGATLISGFVLLTRGTIPTDQARLEWMAQILPLSVLELSHFLGSVVGAALLILAWGVQRRIRRAYRMVRLLFGLGIALALLRSMDAVSVSVLLVGLTVLLAAGRSFPREASLLREPIAPGWSFAMGAAVLLNLFLGVEILDRMGFATDTWWHFALLSRGPRAVRAAVGGAVVLLLFVLARLLASGARR
jgi:phosphatidylglycerol lysyltransferase